MATVTVWVLYVYNENYVCGSKSIIGVYTTIKEVEKAKDRYMIDCFKKQTGVVESNIYIRKVDLDQ